MWQKSRKLYMHIYNILSQSAVSIYSILLPNYCYYYYIFIRICKRENEYTLCKYCTGPRPAKNNKFLQFIDPDFKM